MLNIPRPGSLHHELKRAIGELPPVHLVDIGVSGGFHPAWQNWEGELIALGIDVLEEQIRQLKSAERRPRVHYTAARLTGPTENADEASATAAWSNYALHRSAGYMGTRLLRDRNDENMPLTVENYWAIWRETVQGDSSKFPAEANYANVPNRSEDAFYAYYQALFDNSASAPIEYARKSSTLDDLLRDYDDLHHIDVLKVDTDGWELDILRGSSSAIARGCAIVEVEVQFHGKRGPRANLFANVDTLLRDHGLTLMRLDLRHYSRSALPSPFEYPELPAQTVGGPVQWADALYMRDPLLPDALPLDKKRAQVLAVLLDLYDLRDVAAEVILAFPQYFPNQGRALLDGLARRTTGNDTNYASLVSRMETSVRQFRRPKRHPRNNAP